MKIDVPSEVRDILKKLSDNGKDAYVVGGAVRDSILGKRPPDWDVATNADVDTVTRLFPKSEVLSNELMTVIVDKSDKLTIDVAAFRRESEYSNFKNPDYVEFTDDINEDLRRRDFTVNAVAYNPDKGIVDPYSGLSDIEERLIRTIGDPNERLGEDPIRIMRGIRIAAECDFDIHKDTFQAIQDSVHLLAKIPKERIDEEFTRMLAGSNPDKGLRFSILAGVLPYVFGEACFNGMMKQDREDLTVLAENLTFARPEPVHKYALILRRFKEKCAEDALANLHINKHDKELIHQSLSMVDELYFLNNKIELKRYIKKYGYDTYDFLDKIARQEKKIFDRRDTKVESRHYTLKDMKAFNEPIFIEDLDIDGNDLIDAGIVDQGEEVGKMLDLLLDVVIVKPRLNTKDKLLNEAKKFKKSKLKSKLSKIRWYK